MRSSVFHLLQIITAVLVTTGVSACEGECITGVTNAFIERYQEPIQTVLAQAVSPILSHPHQRKANQPSRPGQRDNQQTARVRCLSASNSINLPVLNHLPRRRTFTAATGYLPWILPWQVRTRRPRQSWWPTSQPAWMSESRLSGGVWNAWVDGTFLSKAAVSCV